MIYIVTYDLIDTNKNYEGLLKLLKSEPAWACLGGSSYLVNSEKSAVELRDHLKTALDSDDKLYVGQAQTPAAWTGMPKDVSEWIKKYL